MSARLTALLLVASLAACGSKTRDNARAGDAPEEAQTEEVAAGVARVSGGALSVFDTATSRVVSAPKGEGFIEVGGVKTWYKVSGEGRGGIPVMLIHDGPGGSSFSMKSLEGLSDERPVVRYDQLGGGRSEITYDGKYFEMERYVKELDSLRARLGFNKVHLVAHSFGAVIALEYYKAHPQFVSSLTLESPEIDFPALQASVRRRIAQMPDSQRVLLGAKPLLGTTARPDYQRALLSFILQNVCCGRAVGADVDSMADSQNDSAYAMLRGSNEVIITGSLADYSATPMLKSIKVPVLYTVGENDVADPATVQRFSSLTPNSRVVVIKGIHHFPTWEAPEENLRIVRDFLRQADGAAPR